jgi:hypothetical protein
VLGRWWSEGEETVVQLRGEELQVPSPAEGEPPSTFRREGTDRYRTLSGRLRDEQGAAVKLW